MDWWKRLKGWQKGALIFGGLHFLLSIVLVQSSSVEGGGLIFVLIALESPWLVLLHLFGIKSPANLLAYTYFPIIIGTMFYALAGGVVWHIAARFYMRRSN